MPQYTLWIYPLLSLIKIGLKCRRQGSNILWASLRLSAHGRFQSLRKRVQAIEDTGDCQRRATVSVLWRAARVERWWVLCYCDLETLNEDSSVGHFDIGSTITAEKILVSTRIPKDTTTKYLWCIRRLAQKATISFVFLPVSWHVRVKQLVSQWTDFCDILYWEILLQFCRENSNWGNIGQKYQAL